MTDATATPDADAGADALLDEAFRRRLERLALRTRRTAGLVGGRAGARRTPAADFVDHRPYSPGDDRRHIDWAAVARHDEVHVKVGRAPEAAQVHLVLDASASMRCESQKARLGLQLAAALGWMSLVHGDRLSVDAFPAPSRRAAWGPASGAAQAASLLAHLTRLATVTAECTELAPALRGIARRAGVGGLLVVVSDLWLHDDLAAALAIVSPPRWDLLVLHVLGVDELRPSLHGTLELRDAEGDGRLLLVVDDAARALYRRGIALRIEQARAATVRRGGAYALIPADWSLERAVVPFLKRRSLLTS